MYMNHRRSKIYDKSDVVGIGKSPIFNLYYSQVENMIASLLDLIWIVSSRGWTDVGLALHLEL